MSYLGAQYSDEFREYYESSIRIIVDNPEVYRELKEVLERVAFHVVDIDEYQEFVEDVVELIGKLTNGGNSEIFDLYQIFFDPVKLGKATTFRFFCEQLLKKLYLFRDYRNEQRGERRLSLVKSGAVMLFEGNRKSDIRKHLKLIYGA